MSDAMDVTPVDTTGAAQCEDMRVRIVSMVTPAATSSSMTKAIFEEDNADICVASVSYSLPYAVQIDGVLQNLQSVVVPFADLLDNLSGGRHAQRGKNVDTTSSNTGTDIVGDISSDAPAIRKIPKPKADDSLQKQKIERFLKRLLFPSSLSNETMADISNTGIILHITQESLRLNFNSPGLMDLIHRSMREGHVRIYVLLAESKLAALRQVLDKASARSTPRSARPGRDPEVSGTVDSVVVEYVEFFIFDFLL